jgi:hypothetical protein
MPVQVRSRAPKKKIQIPAMGSGFLLLLLSLFNPLFGFEKQHGKVELLGKSSNPLRRDSVFIDSL